MIYGLDDDEFGLVTTSKFNKKKFFIVIAIVVIAFLIVFISFKISLGFINKNVDKIAAQNESSEINKEETSNPTLGAQKIENVNLPGEEKNTENSNPDYDDTVYNSDGSAINEIDSNKENQSNNEHKQIPVHDIEQIKSNVLPQPNENALSLIKDIYKSDEKQIYLTFDDGPSKDITPKILDILKQYDVKATFFVLGARVDLYPDTLKREFNEGHYIANHGYSHKYSSIYESKDTVFEEYIACENSIKKALNNDNYNCYLFRFPGGSSGGPYSKVKSEARELLSSYGIAYTNWNCLTGDAENKKTKEECIEEMKSTKENQNSIILLMHDANDKQQTVDALPEIIEFYKNQGYTFKTFYEIFK